MSTTEPEGTSTTTPEPTTSKKAKPAPTATGSEALVSVSATIPQSLKDLIDQRAEHEERTQAVVIRRALKAYMEDWSPATTD